MTSKVPSMLSLTSSIAESQPLIIDRFLLFPKGRLGTVTDRVCRDIAAVRFCLIELCHRLSHNFVRLSRLTGIACLVTPRHMTFNFEYSESTSIPSSEAAT